MWTHSGNLPCKYIIHTVGPECNKEKPINYTKEQTMSSCIKAVLNLMIEKKCESLCLPIMKSQTCQFPLERLTYVYADTIMKFIDENEKMNGKEIIICKSKFLT